MQKKRETELARLKQFCVVAVTYLGELAGGSLSREPFVRAFEASHSVRGMREASRDMIEWGQDLSELQVSELDSRLAALGLPTFALMRAKRNREVSRVLARGHVASEDECRLLNAIVSNIETEGLAPSDCALASRLMGEYEQKSG